MNSSPKLSLRLLLPLPVLLLALVSCAGGGGGAAWTFAPLAPTVPPVPSPGASPGGSPGTSPAGSPGGSPAGSPGGSPGQGVALQVTTPASDPVAFDPTELTAPPGVDATLQYTNESNLPHNVNVFAGSDPGAGSLVKTEVITGPGASTSVTFTTPSEAGDYYFHCDIHPNMQGTLRVGE